MRYVSIGFHILMLVLVAAAFGGAFAPAPSGSFSRDAAGNTNMIIGLIVVWIIGAIVLRVVRRFSKP